MATKNKKEKKKIKTPNLLKISFSPHPSSCGRKRGAPARLLNGENNPRTVGLGGVKETRAGGARGPPRGTARHSAAGRGAARLRRAAAAGRAACRGRGAQSRLRARAGGRRSAGAPARSILPYRKWRASPDPGGDFKAGRGRGSAARRRGEEERRRGGGAPGAPAARPRRP